MTTQVPVRPDARPASAGRRAWTPHVGTIPALVLVLPLALVALLFIVYPLVRLTLDAFTQGDGGLSNFTAVFQSRAILNSLLNTIGMSLVVTVLCLVLGGSLAWAVARARRPVIKALLWTSILVPFWMGVVVKSYAWAVIFANNGILNSTLQNLGLTGEPLSLLYTRFAVIVGMTYTMLPYAVLAMYPTMSGFNAELLNSARIMGSSRTGAMVKVWLPLVRPGIIAAGAIVFAISIGFYITPVLLGGAQTPFMATIIGDDIFAFFNYPRAAASSVLLLTFALVVLGTAMRFVGAKALKGGLRA